MPSAGRSPRSQRSRQGLDLESIYLSDSGATGLTGVTGGRTDPVSQMGRSTASAAHTQLETSGPSEHYDSVNVGVGDQTPESGSAGNGPHGSPSTEEAPSRMVAQLRVMAQLQQGGSGSPVLTHLSVPTPGRTCTEDAATVPTNLPRNSSKGSSVASLAGTGVLNTAPQAPVASTGRPPPRQPRTGEREGIAPPPLQTVPSHSSVGSVAQQSRRTNRNSADSICSPQQSSSATGSGSQCPSGPLGDQLRWLRSRLAQQWDDLRQVQKAVEAAAAATAVPPASEPRSAAAAVRASELLEPARALLARLCGESPAELPFLLSAELSPPHSQQTQPRAPLPMQLRTPPLASTPVAPQAPGLGPEASPDFHPQMPPVRPHSPQSVSMPAALGGTPRAGLPHNRPGAVPPGPGQLARATSGGAQSSSAWAQSQQARRCSIESEAMQRRMSNVSHRGAVRRQQSGRLLQNRRTAPEPLPGSASTRPLSRVGSSGSSVINSPRPPAEPAAMVRQLSQGTFLSGVLPSPAPVIETSEVSKARDRSTGLKLINDYEIVKELGRGSFAKVKLCRSRLDGTELALKVMKKSLLRNLGRFAGRARGATGGLLTALQRVQQEVAIMKKLRHRNLVSLHEVIDDPEHDKLILVMDYMPGGPVGFVDSDGSLPVGRLHEGRLKRILLGAVRGLRYLHHSGIVHRDIKPENILLDKDRNARVADFGTCYVCPAGEGDMISGTEGTPAFFAPESIPQGSGGVPCYSGMAADVWALGVTAYALAVGKVPFFSRDRRTLCEQILREPIDLRGLGLSARFSDILRRMLERDIARRISLRELRRSALLELEDGSPLSPKRPRSNKADSPRRPGATHRPRRSSAAVPSPVNAPSPSPSQQSSRQRQSTEPAPAHAVIPRRQTYAGPSSANAGRSGLPPISPPFNSAPSPHNRDSVASPAPQLPPSGDPRTPPPQPVEISISVSPPASPGGGIKSLGSTLGTSTVSPAHGQARTFSPSSPNREGAREGARSATLSPERRCPRPAPLPATVASASNPAPRQEETEEVPHRGILTTPTNPHRVVQLGSGDLAQRDPTGGSFAQRDPTGGVLSDGVVQEPEKPGTEGVPSLSPSASPGDEEGGAQAPAPGDAEVVEVDFEEEEEFEEQEEEDSDSGDSAGPNACGKWVRPDLSPGDLEDALSVVHARGDLDADTFNSSATWGSGSPDRLALDGTAPAAGRGAAVRRQRGSDPRPVGASGVRPSFRRSDTDREGFFGWTFGDPEQDQDESLLGTQRGGARSSTHSAASSPSAAGSQTLQLSIGGSRGCNSRQRTRMRRARAATAGSPETKSSPLANRSRSPYSSSGDEIEQRSMQSLSDRRKTIPASTDRQPSPTAGVSPGQRPQQYSEQFHPDQLMVQSIRTDCHSSEGHTSAADPANVPHYQPVNVGNSRSPVQQQPSPASQQRSRIAAGCVAAWAGQWASSEGIATDPDAGSGLTLQSPRPAFVDTPGKSAGDTSASDSDGVGVT
eukprot:TRINITY_DN219_c0_g2_i1.p1 TRINITY_DN219_c0_g2~~TRINITY_DN219_c0_g2_i1.p1  ORF type:complete len:1501 (+),score=273.00 TRINITY_DN219_c0_g2_i1:124-4626(+)